MPGYPRFLAEPRVLGGIGVPPPSTLEELIARHELKPVVLRPDGFLYATHGAMPWQTAEEHGWHWHPLDRHAEVGSMKDAQVHAMSSGIAFTTSGPTLHNDLLGIQPLFWTHVDSGVFFSNWMRMLAVLHHNLTEDEEAWASTLLLGFAAPGATVFREICSLPPNGTLRFVQGQAVVAGASLDITTNDRPAVIRAIRRGLPPRRQPAAYTLSGGWDSRLLAAIASERPFGRKLETWTTGKDDGVALDLDLARPVAKVLKTDHHELMPPPEFWPGSAGEALTRFDHSTWDHVWLEPLAASVRRRERPVVDGLAGDVLFKGLFQDPEEDRKGHSRDARYRLWLNLGGRFVEDREAWSPVALGRFETAFESFDQSIQDLLEQPGWQTMAVLVTRTARTIALSPLRLFGPEVPVYLPFISLPVLSAALGPGIHPHRGSDFYRSLIGSVSPRLAALPSTNDDGLAGRTGRPRGHDQPESLAAMIDIIKAQEPALDLLAAPMRSAIVSEDVEALHSSLGKYRARVLWGVHAYASWRQAYDIE